MPVHAEHEWLESRGSSTQLLLRLLLGCRRDKWVLVLMFLKAARAGVRWGVEWLSLPLRLGPLLGEIESGRLARSGIVRTVLRRGGLVRVHTWVRVLFGWRHFDRSAQQSDVVLVFGDAVKKKPTVKEDKRSNELIPKED